MPADEKPTPVERDYSEALPTGYRLAEFELRGVLGVGGFGIVYQAWDHALEREVALKEYLPLALAGRGQGSQVTLRSKTQADTFAIGLRSFVNEARLLARFDHPSLLKVYRFWEDHGTAYMVMPYYRGRTLRQARAALPQPPDEAWCRAVLGPLLGALELLHKADVFHRDIAPDNVLLSDDTTPVLLDFGAARRVIANATQSLTAILKPSFAPVEQYADSSNLRQGAWTDIYALAATFYWVITGQMPFPAVARAVTDELPPLQRIAPPGYSAGFLQALDAAMAVRPSERPQSVQALREALGLQGPAAPPMRLVPANEPLPASFGATAATPAVAEPDVDAEPTLVRPRTVAPAADDATVVSPRTEEAPVVDSVATVLLPRTEPPPPTVIEPVPEPVQPPPAVVPPRPRPWGWLGAAAVVVLALAAWLVLRPSAAPPVEVVASPVPSASAIEPPASAPEEVLAMPVPASQPAVVEPVAVAPVAAPEVRAPVVVKAATRPPAPARAATRPASSAEAAAQPARHDHLRAAAAEAPAPVTEAPKPTASSGVCADRTAIARFICLQTECYKAANHEQPACVAFTRAERERMEQQGQR